MKIKTSGIYHKFQLSAILMDIRFTSSVHFHQLYTIKINPGTALIHCAYLITRIQPHIFN